MSQSDFARGFDMGFRACLDQIQLTGLEPKSASAVDEFIRAARRRLGIRDPDRPRFRAALPEELD